MENIKIYDYNRSVVKRKHVLIAMFIALVPVINIVISTVSLALYGALIAEHLTKDEGWLDQPFKRKNKD